MKIVDKTELKKFIFSQDDDRQIEMLENYSDSSCGCVLVHYGKEVLNLTEFACAYDSFESLTNDDDDVQLLAKIPDLKGFIRYCARNNIKTYKDAKEMWEKFDKENAECVS